MGGYETGIGYFVGYSTNIYFFSEDTAEKKCSFYLFIYLLTYLLICLFIYFLFNHITSVRTASFLHHICLLQTTEGSQES